ncbi:MAG: hypothetical protein ACYDDY_12060 [Mucilaginibacter sp.]
MTKYKLAAIVSDYYKIHPELNKGADTDIYNEKTPGYEQDYFNCYIQSGTDTCIFIFSFLGDSAYWAENKHSEIGLRYACKYGQLLKINSDLGFLKKKIYKNF